MHAGNASTAALLDPPFMERELFGPAPFGAVTQLEQPGTASMPEPYRSLLVHDEDMTSTLERHHREPIVLRVLGRLLEDEVLQRRVLLVGEKSGRVVELGAIRIELGRFPSAARAEVEAGVRPLGAILTASGMAFTSRPRQFFALRPASGVRSLLELSSEFGPGGDSLLFGRHNVLLAADGGRLAEVVEILPTLAG